MDQKEVPIKNVFEVNEELGDEEQTSKKEKNWKSRRVCMVTSQTEPCINNDNFQTRKFRY